MTETPNKVDPAPGSGRSSLADLVDPPSALTGEGTSHRGTIIKIAVIAGLFVALNFWQFRVLLIRWREPDWSHGYIIPLFSAFLIWNTRDALLRAKPRVCLWALPMMLLAFLGQVLAFYHPSLRNNWICQICMVGMLFFLVLYLAGPSVIRVVWLPILYLVLAMPVPGGLYTSMSLPLQNIAAKGSTGILAMLGVQVNATQSNLSITSVSGVLHGVTVAEACSGMRSLLAYVALGVAWAYLEDRPVWQRVTLVLIIIPVAVFCNVVRVAITCMAYYYDEPVLGQDFMHTATGMLMLIPALLLFMLASWLLKKLVIEEDDSPDATQTASAGGAGA